jgi:hypothetical protein
MLAGTATKWVELGTHGKKGAQELGKLLCPAVQIELMSYKD